MTNALKCLDVTDVGGGVALVRLNRPPVNAISEDMFEEIREYFEGVGYNDGVDAIVITGAGDRAFSGGNDLQEFLELTVDNGDERMALVWRALYAVYSCAVPTISAVNGPALGSGFAIVSCSDLVVASTSAKFCLPELNVGVLGGSKFAARMIPEQAMRRMLFTAEAISAEHMVAWGAPFEIVEPEHLVESSIRLAQSIAQKGTHAVRLAKGAMNGCEPMDLFGGYRLEQSYTVRMSGHPESRAATQATVDRLALKKTAIK